MQFDFGQNWAEFSEHALTPERVDEARKAFESLLSHAGGVSGKSFLDIGFGHGWGLLSAARAGAHVFGVEINPKCEEVLRRNRQFFPGLERLDIAVAIGSILYDRIVSQARAGSPEDSGYEIVHSWGVLHHTGDMRRAVSNAASLVRPGGHLVISIYNRHWTSPYWRIIKYVYCKSPRLVQQALVGLLFPVIYAAKWIVTGTDPRKQLRGMDFYYDVIDWVGGYPYEYASAAEVVSLVEPLGFRCVHYVPAQVPTGCNEFVFERI